MVNKVIREGKVAVLYSPGFGAGWSTWAGAGLQDFALYSPEIVELVEQNRHNEIKNKVKEILGDTYFCTLGAADLEIEWVPVGTAFIVSEYDGSEAIYFKEDHNWDIA